MDSITDYIILLIATLFASIISGIVGAGGGFIITPLMIALGLTPAQAITTGKIGGLVVTLGSLGGLRKSTYKVSKYKIAAITILALFVALLVPQVIISLNSDVYQTILGIFIILIIPLLFYKKIGKKSYKPGTLKYIIGTISLTIALFLQGIFSGGLGTLVNIVLMGLLGMNATEANITKRWSQLVLNVVIVIGVIGSGLIVWKVALLMIPATLGGSYYGARLAVKKGNDFIMIILIILMLISGLYLIFS